MSQPKPGTETSFFDFSCQLTIVNQSGPYGGKAANFFQDIRPHHDAASCGRRHMFRTTVSQRKGV